MATLYASGGRFGPQINGLNDCFCSADVPRYSAKSQSSVIFGTMAQSTGTQVLCRCLFLVLALSSEGAGLAQPLPRKGLFGVNLAPVSRAWREQSGITDSGLRIASMASGSTAEIAGLKVGDILLKLNRRKVVTPWDVQEFCGFTAVGTEFTIEYWRDAKVQTATGKLQEKSKETSEKYDVDYGQVVSNGKRLRTIVTRPKGVANRPAILLVQSLGPATIDLPLTASDPYCRILHSFATSGFVTMRVEKPGIGDSEGGPISDVDFKSDVDVFRQALADLKKNPYVNPDRIIIFGHSIGSSYVPIFASEMPVAGIAVYGTVAKSFEEYFDENARRQAELMGLEAAQVDQIVKSQRAALHYLLYEAKTPPRIRQEKPNLTTALYALMPDDRTMYSRIPGYWSQIANTNFPAYWQKISCPTLALWGESDYFTAREDHELVARIINRRNPGKGAFKTIPASDHVFTQAKSFLESFNKWGSFEPDFNSNIILELKSWIETVLPKG